MVHRIFLFILCFFWLFDQQALSAQINPDSVFIHIERIDAIGQIRTRKAFIMRELLIQPGDSILACDLDHALKTNELRLLNTHVFRSVFIQIDQWHGPEQISLCVSGVEGFYLDAIPQVELADRNFNVWWRDYAHSLRRVNIGGYIKHFNTTGNGDPIKLLIQVGYTNKLEVIYRRPFINRAKTISLEAQVLYSQSKEVSYQTEKNSQVFYFDPNQFQYFRRRLILQFGYKPKNLSSFNLRGEYLFYSVGDTVARELNPNFFGNNQTKQKYLALALSYERDERDIKPYPLHGKLIRLELRQNGLPSLNQLNITLASAQMRLYRSFGKKLSYELDVYSRIALHRKDVPFINNQALGYFDNYIRGYEFYVIDGLDFGLLKQSFRHQIWDKPIQIPQKLMPLHTFRTNPLKVYLSSHIDFGYARYANVSRTNTLNNRPLMGYGLGISFVARYHSVLSLEWSRNDLGENGYYLHIGAKR
jgi:outer membrane protein assembly factor BamA